MKETLTKENFWNDMMQKYPNATKAFCDWMDEYKESVNWNSLFNAGVPKYVEGSAFKSGTEAPKYHDLPYAMQMGIWIEYLCKRGGCEWEIEDMFTYDLAKDIEGMFRELLEEEAINALES